MRFLPTAAVVVATLQSTVHARARGGPNIFARENPVSCQAVDPKLPSNFRCPAGNDCISLASSTASICCPVGQNCQQIATILCDVALQDANKNPNQPIHTTNTGGTLPTCGNQCCPFGYTCGTLNGQPVCELVKAQAMTTAPSSSVTSQGKSTTTQTISTTTATATPTSASGLDSENPPPSKESSFSTTVLMAGLIPGVVVGILAALALVICLRRRRKRIGRTGPRPTISAPMDMRGERPDFLLQAHLGARTTSSPYRRSTSSRKGPGNDDFWTAKMPTPPENNNVPANYLRDMPDVPVSPRRRVARYPSRDSLGRTIDEKDFAEPPRGISQGLTERDVEDSSRPETIRIYSPDLAQTGIAVAPLRGMNTRRSSPLSQGYGYGGLGRTDSGKGLEAPFKTPEKKAQIINITYPLTNIAQGATYHDITTNSPVSPIHDEAPLQMLTPARYDPNSHNGPKSLYPSTRPPPPAQSQRPDLPLHPSQRVKDAVHEPDFDFDAGIDSQPLTPMPALMTPRGNMKPGHETSATTFTTLLRAAGFPDTQHDQLEPAVPSIPRGYHQRKPNDTKKPAGGKKKGVI